MGRPRAAIAGSTNRLSTRGPRARRDGRQETLEDHGEGSDEHRSGLRTIEAYLRFGRALSTAREPGARTYAAHVAAHAVRTRIPEVFDLVQAALSETEGLDYRLLVEANGDSTDEERLFTDDDIDEEEGVLTDEELEDWGA